MKPKIIFFGTPHFALEILKEISSLNYNVEALVTAPDRPAGRGRKIKTFEIKQYAINNNISIYQPYDLKDEEFINNLKKHRANLFVVVAFRFIPKIIWSIPELGTFNLHASLLPDYRGAAPINWAIINREKITGVTTFLIDENIDTGKILLTKKCDINSLDNYESLYNKLLILAKELVLETIICLITKNISPKKQKIIKKINFAPKLNNQNTKINWMFPLNYIYSLIKGLSPYPGAWAILNDCNLKTRFKILDCEIEYLNHKIDKNYILVEGKRIKILHKEGFLIIKSIQIANKKILKSSEFLNGYTLKPTVFVE